MFHHSCICHSSVVYCIILQNTLNHQLTPKLRSLLALEQSLELGSAAQELYRCQLSCKCQVYNPLQSMWAMPYELDAPSVWAISQQTLEVVDHDIITRVTLV